MIRKVIIQIVVSPLCLVLFFINSQAQSITVGPGTLLPIETKETSGLIILNDHLITHNDSGNEAILYEIEPESGSLLREIEVKNATNGDWEDLTTDQQYLYVADIGNNHGDRTDLRVYRAPLTDFQNTNNTLNAEAISFSYQDQISFEPTQLTNYDAEALIAFEDSLYIFTKNWADQHTNIYSIPKVPGAYEAKRIGRINALGLVTGATYNQATNEVLLVGYNLSNAFLIRLWDFETFMFHAGKMEKIPLNLPGSFQSEAITTINDTGYFITTEGNEFGDAMLYRLATDFVVGLNDSVPGSLEIFPNPTSGLLNIRGNTQSLRSISIYNTIGVNVYSSMNIGDFPNNQIRLDLNHLPSGLYQVNVTTGETRQLRKLIITNSRL